MYSLVTRYFPMNLSTFLTLQLIRISSKPPSHASGPKKPDLSDHDHSQEKGK